MTSASGWFPDPDNLSRERWWDGAAWTVSTRPRAAAQSQSRSGIARRGFVLGIVATALAAATMLSAFLGSTGAEPNMGLTVSVFVLMPAATVTGVIGIVLSTIGRARAVGTEERRVAASGLALSIVGACAILLLLLGVFASVLLVSV
ncbi:DUF2510 domain-containing protein [Leifsonia sp. McL0607]|uniref:DUF2510 domain-containing protein n=1 Tax=Leifsonia sp. McL0607 TaxID=3415672 RepID=UPI003CE74099